MNIKYPGGIPDANQLNCKSKWSRNSNKFEKETFPKMDNQLNKVLKNAILNMGLSAHTLQSFWDFSPSKNTTSKMRNDLPNLTLMVSPKIGLPAS